MHLRYLSLSVLLFLVSSATAADVLTWDEAYAKADKLVSQLTLDQMVSISQGKGLFLGKCTGVSGGTTDPDFPGLCLSDGPLGVRASPYASAFPAGINAAASFDKEAIHRRGLDMGAEFRRKGANVQLGPAMNIARVPDAGRNWEGFGEDPYLAGVAAAETIKAIQSQEVISAAKHFITNEQETKRMLHSTQVDDRTLHEIYLWPFARSVEAGVGTIMCSYNKINGTYACEDDHTLNQILKGELGFRGFVHSDWLATHSTAEAANNGLDMNLPGGFPYFGSALKRAVKHGHVDIKRVEDMSRRIIAAWYKMRQDEDYPSVKMNQNLGIADPGMDVQDDHKVSIRKLGAASVVLLRNQNQTLPITSSVIKFIAVIGEDAKRDPKRKNNTSCGPLSKCDDGTLIQGGGSGSSNIPYIIAPVDGITARAENSSIQVTSHLKNSQLSKAASTAKSADMAIVFAHKFAGESSDLNNLDLDNNANELIETVADANKNTVVVIHAGNPVLMPWIDHPNITAIVWAGYPGQETGNSLADVLFGDINPSGRLPITIAKKESDYPALSTSDMTIDYSERLLVGYRWFDATGIEPQFEFGFGLSYTTFQYSGLKVTTEKDSVNASLTIKNTGDFDGAEVVQAYIAFPDSAYERPKVLRGFEKVFVKKGESAQINFQFGKTELSIWDVEKQEWVIPSGLFRLHIGASSRDIRLSKAFKM